MPGRKYSAGTQYRYGFNGKENDNEVSGWQDYGMREYDVRLGRFFSIDPLTKQYPFYTPYQFSGNSAIANIDLDGGEPKYVAAPVGTGKVKLTFPVVAMIAELYGMNYYRAGARANIVINQDIHDRITKYNSGAITLGFEINYTGNYQNASARDFLELTGHEIVHVEQFIGRYGAEFSSENEYQKSVLHWMASYGADAADVYLKSKDKDKSQLHDKILTETEAISKETVFFEFLRSNDFVRKRNSKNGVKEIQDNRVINLLKALDDAKDKNQKGRYKANFNKLMKLVSEYKEKTKKENDNKNQKPSNKE